MPGGTMDANTDTLARAAKMADVVAQEIEGQRKSLDSHVNSVIPAQWSMMQSQAAMQAFKKWDAAVRNLCEKLTKLGGDTQFAMNDYSQVDEQGASRLNSAGGGDMGSGGGAGGLGAGGGLGLGGGDMGGGDAGGSGGVAGGLGGGEASGSGGGSDAGGSGGEGDAGGSTGGSDSGGSDD